MSYINSYFNDTRQLPRIRIIKDSVNSFGIDSLKSVYESSKAGNNEIGQLSEDLEIEMVDLQKDIKIECMSEDIRQLETSRSVEIKQESKLLTDNEVQKYLKYNRMHTEINEQTFEHQNDKYQNIEGKRTKAKQNGSNKGQQSQSQERGCLNFLLDIGTDKCKNCNKNLHAHQVPRLLEPYPSEVYLNIDSRRSRQDYDPMTLSEKIQHSLRIKSNKSNQSKLKLNRLDNLTIQAKTFYCQICYLDCPIDQIMIIKCGHYFCKDCLQGFLDFMINQSGIVYKMKCPSAGCEKTFDKENLKDWLSEDNFHKFQKFMANYEVSKSNNKRFCPQVNCEQIVEGKKGQTKTECPKCMKHFCFQCQLPWHQGINCKEAQAKVYKDWAINIGANQCPNCKAPVQKDKGCHHMNCIVCNYKWCWVCGNSLDHWIHKFEQSPFNCSKAPKNKKNKCQFFALFILGLLFMPLIIYIIMMGVCMYFGASMFFKAVDNCKACDRIFGCLCLSTIFLPYITIVLVLSATFSCMASILLLLPAYYVHIYGYMSAYNWWRKSTRMQNMTQFQIANPEMTTKQLDRDNKV